MYVVYVGETNDVVGETQLNFDPALLSLLCLWIVPIRYVLTNDVYSCDFILFIVLIWYGTYVCVVSIVFQFALDMYTNLTFDMISKEINISARGSRLYSGGAQNIFHVYIFVSLLYRKGEQLATF